MKIEKIKSSYIHGYKLGRYYLIKCYEWGNYYEWIISDILDSFSCSIDRRKAYENKDIKYVDSCASGKKLLLQLENGAIKFEDIKGR